MVAGSVRKAKSKPRKDGYTLGDRYEYVCGTYFKAAAGRIPRSECKCLRNGVFQDVLDGYIEQYLEEAGKRLDLLTQAPQEGNGTSHLTDRLQEQEFGAWGEFSAGMGRLETYLAEHHEEEYHAMVKESYNPESPNAAGFIHQCLDLYRHHFNPDSLTADIERLEGEHSALMERWSDLPTPQG
jgi:hypothetical protein